MPYIKTGARVLYDEAINEIIDTVRTNGNEDGDLNYIISRIVVGSLKPATGWKYAIMARVIAVFECAKLEAYRRLAADYENKAIGKNGDIEEYK